MMLFGRDFYLPDAANWERDQPTDDKPVGNLDGYEDRKAKPADGSGSEPDATALDGAGNTLLDMPDGLALKEEKALVHDAPTISTNAPSSERESPHGGYRLAGDGTVAKMVDFSYKAPSIHS